uniref:Uncharacterized protein n=1 Tax=Meloidogyne enterolobii TaxID=390850 RepID=A0A6V7TRZ5_MELEN|nr:unnamed protein product [Meloidogyne enterolobii]
MKIVAKLPPQNNEKQRALIFREEMLKIEKYIREMVEIERCLF